MSNLFPPDVLGGYELLAGDVARGLKERGHAVTVITTGHRKGGPDEASYAGVRVERILRLARPFGSAPQRDRLRHFVAAAANRRALVSLLERHGAPDAVLVMSLRRLGLEPARVYAARGVPLTFTVNDDWPIAFVPSRRGIGALLDAVSPLPLTWQALRVERVVYLSDAIRQQIREAGAPLPLGRVQPQGVRPSMFPTRPFRALPASPRLLFVGRLHPTKAPETAIDAIAALRARGVTATLEIAGEAADGVYGASLRARAEGLGVASAITWHGFVDRRRLPELFARCDALLFPSAWEGEGQGLTYMEAMAAGLLVVAFPLGGARELLDAYPVAVRAASGTGEAFADAILSILPDVDRQRALVAAALRMVREEVSFDRYVDALEEELVAGARTCTPAQGVRRPGRAAVVQS